MLHVLRFQRRKDTVYIGSSLSTVDIVQPIGNVFGELSGVKLSKMEMVFIATLLDDHVKILATLESGDLDTSPLGASGAEVPSVCFCVAHFTRSATGSKNIQKYLRGLPTLLAKRKVAFPGMGSWEKSCLQAPHYFQKICDGMSTKKFGEAVLQKLKDLTPPHEGSCRLPSCFCVFERIWEVSRCYARQCSLSLPLSLSLSLSLFLPPCISLALSLFNLLPLSLIHRCYFRLLLYFVSRVHAPIKLHRHIGICYMLCTYLYLHHIGAQMFTNL